MFKYLKSLIVSIHKSESSSSVCIVLTIIDLECFEGNLKFCSFGGDKQPSNAKVKHSFTDSSVEFKCIVNGDRKERRYYSWTVKKLPTRIKADKTKVKVSLSSRLSKVLVNFFKTNLQF